MAKIRAIDQAVVITSELTNEQLEKAVKYFPEVLTVKEKNEDGKSVPVFAVNTTKSAGSVNKYGMSFPVGCKSEKASITITIDKMSKEKRLEFVKDTLGKPLTYLQAIETAYADAEKAFADTYKKLEASIVVE